MKRKILFFMHVATIFVMAGRISSTYAASLEELVNTNVIDNDVVDAIQNARAEGINVMVLTKVHDGETKVSIVVGEKHCLNCSSTSQAGRDLVDTVPKRALEGYEASTLVSKAACGCLTPLFCCLGQCYPLKCGSLIAYALASKNNEKQPLLEEGLAPEEIQNFHLEDGHKGDWSENIAIISTISLPAGCLSIPIAKLVSTTAVSNIVANVYMGYVGSMLFAQASSYLLEKYLPWSYSTSWMRWFGINGLIISRNETMAANIDKIFHNKPEVKILLSAMGTGHVSHLIRLLINEYGYTLIEN